MHGKIPFIYMMRINLPMNRFLRICIHLFFNITNTDGCVFFLLFFQFARIYTEIRVTFYVRKNSQNKCESLEPGRYFT